MKSEPRAAETASMLRFHCSSLLSIVVSAGRSRQSPAKMRLCAKIPLLIHCYTSEPFRAVKYY
jgi:hypothetical protein